MTGDVHGSRRAVLKAAAAGSAGLIAGGLAGAAATQAVRPAAAPIVHARRFGGKVVLITGATSGIGAAAARQFAAEGAKVGFCGRRSERGAQVEREIRASGGEAFYVRADVRDEQQVKAFVDRVAGRYGGLDVCFNNAGITIEKPLEQMSAAEWDDVQHTNLRGNFYALKHEIPWLRRRGGGVIVVTSSSNAIATSGKRGAYASSKRGLIGFVQAAAQELADDNIRINALVPGTTDTELVRRSAGMMNAPDAVWQAAAALWARNNVPVAKRMARPEEIAAFALGLASSEYPYLTGSALVIDGGKTTHA
ncbi:MAG TPA: SDR family NAD(P)-dependent oxidoreductase [Sphingomonas sp.]|nr:SDR family NAD(P)-dependent oxidoreductase [Sphingomonas sp.]